MDTYSKFQGPVQDQAWSKAQRGSVVRSEPEQKPGKRSPSSLSLVKPQSQGFLYYYQCNYYIQWNHYSFCWEWKLYLFHCPHSLSSTVIDSTEARGEIGLWQFKHAVSNLFSFSLNQLQKRIRTRNKASADCSPCNCHTNDWDKSIKLATIVPGCLNYKSR